MNSWIPNSASGRKFTYAYVSPPLSNAADASSEMITESSVVWLTTVQPLTSSFWSPSELPPYTGLLEFSRACPRLPEQVMQPPVKEKRC